MPRTLATLPFLFLTALHWCASGVSAHGLLNVPAEYPTLSDAFVAAHSNDIIYIQPGVYFEAEHSYPGDGLTAGPMLDSLTNVTIVGAVAGEVIIDLGDYHHGLAILGSSAIISIQGLTFRGNGAALLSALDSTASVTLENCTFECGPAVTTAFAATLGFHRVFKCTFAGPGQGGPTVTTALGIAGAGNIMKDSIVTGFDQVIADPASLSASYSCFHEVGGVLPAGIGNFSADPLFVDAASGDFHLRSVRGRWDLALQDFATDSVSSPCIDAGDPAASVIGETWPHGSRVNLGALAATVRASRSPEACAFNLCGDCDGDGAVRILDALQVAQISVQLLPAPLRGSNRFDSCNVRGLQMPDPGAAIDILDALNLARFASGAIGGLSCCP